VKSISWLLTSHAERSYVTLVMLEYTRTIIVNVVFVVVSSDISRRRIIRCRPLCGLNVSTSSPLTCWPSCGNNLSWRKNQSGLRV